MNCREFDQMLDDLVDGALPDPAEKAARRHVASCGRCRRRLEDDEALRKDLSRLPVPPMPSGMPDRVLARAREQAAPQQNRPAQLATLALAASLAVGIGLGVVLVGKESTPNAPTLGDQVVLNAAPGKARTITLLYHTDKPLPGVTMTLRIPAHVSLEGYGDRRELTWKTDLRAGENTLRLPLIPRAEGRGYMETELVRGDERKSFRVELVVSPGQDSPMGEGLETDNLNRA